MCAVVILGFAINLGYLSTEKVKWESYRIWRIIGLWFEAKEQELLDRVKSKKV
jgi:hypothetical protein